MSLTRPNNDNESQTFKAYSPIHQPESKKIILIELTSILAFIAFILFRTVLYFWSEELLPTFAEGIELFSLFSCWLTNSTLVCGALISFVTWHLMYFDSAVPGINPPTPLSPSKYRAMSGANIHLNFLFAIAIGPMVAILTHFQYA